MSLRGITLAVVLFAAVASVGLNANQHPARAAKIYPSASPSVIEPWNTPAPTTATTSTEPAASVPQAVPSPLPAKRAALAFETAAVLLLIVLVAVLAVILVFRRFRGDRRS